MIGNRAQGTRLIIWSLFSNICTIECIIFYVFKMREDQKTKFQGKPKKGDFYFIGSKDKETL